MTTITHYSTDCLLLHGNIKQDKQGKLVVSMCVCVCVCVCVCRGVARILEKRGQKCQVIARKARKIGGPEATPTPLNHVGLVIQYAMLIHFTLTRGARSLEVSEKFVRKETALWSTLL